MRPVWIAALLLAALSACAKSARQPPQSAEQRPAQARGAVAQPQPPDSSGRVRLAEGAFAFADSSGALLLALGPLNEPAAVRTAICRGADRHRVSYLRTQERSASDNGRQTAGNFARGAGQVFRVLDRRVFEDETCYLTADSTLAARAGSATGAAIPECRPDWAPNVEAVRGRPVVDCQPMTVGPDDLILFAVRFKTLDTNALASIVALDGDRPRFLDFPATDRGPDESVWRVDDGGVFSPADFRVLFVSRVRGVLVLALTWAGAEGENEYLLAADSSGSFRAVSQTYRYWVPE